jgi:hypothetical protein
MVIPGNSPTRATTSQDQRGSGLTEDDRPMAGNKVSVVFTLMASWWRGLHDDGLTIGIALVAAVIVSAAIDEIGVSLRSIELHFP